MGGGGRGAGEGGGRRSKGHMTGAANSRVCVPHTSQHADTCRALNKPLETITPPT